MKLHNLKRTIAASALGLAALLGTSEIANAQNSRRDQRQPQRVERQQQRDDYQRARIEQQRQEQLRRQNMQNNRYGNVYSDSNNNGYNNRYRVYRNGSYYQTDNRGAELLRQAVNRGYQEGIRAGQSDRGSRRGSNWGNSSIYRSGNSGYQSYVDSSQYQYYFRQGFERGYQDGYNSRYQYGTNNNGAFNILGTILQGILNIQRY